MKNKQKLSLLMVASGFFSAVLALVVVGLTSCFEATPDARNFGPEVSAQSIADAMNGPLLQLNPESIQTGEFVHIETNQAVEGGTKFVTRDTGISVLSRTDNGSTLTFKLAFEEIEYSSDGSSNRSVYEENIDVAKASTSALSAFSSATRFLPASTLRANNSIPLCEPVISDDVTYHQLSTSSQTVNVPTQVQSTDFCTGQNPCTMPVTHVSFDQVVWSGEEGDKIKCQYTYSTAVPYLAAQVQRCVTLAVPYDNRSVLLTECSDVLNFQEGS